MYTRRLVAWFIWRRISTNCKLACFGNLARVVCENCKMRLFDISLKQLSGYLAVVMIFPSMSFLTETVMIISSDKCRRGWHGTVMCSSTTQGRHLRHLLSTFHHCNLTPPPPPSVQDIRRKQFSLVSIVCSLHCVDHQSKDTDGFLSQKLIIPKLKFCQPSVWYALNMCMYPGWVRKHIVREGLTLISTICVQSGNVSQRLTCAVSYAVRWHQPSFKHMLMHLMYIYRTIHNHMFCWTLSLIVVYMQKLPILQSWLLDIYKECCRCIFGHPCVLFVRCMLRPKLAVFSKNTE